MTDKEKTKAYDEAIRKAQDVSHTSEFIKITDLFPELRESEDERIRKYLIEELKVAKSVGELLYTIPQPTREECIAYLEKQKEQSITANDLDEEIHRFFDDCIEVHDAKIYGVDERVITVDCYEITAHHFAKWGEKQKEQESIKMEGTTICGQDYKCKKDYKAGNCWYIKDAIYHCGRDGYLTDQNSVSWSCTPEWFKEYIQSNTEWAEEEKTRFVSGQFLQCKLSFGGFKEGEHYWLEYIGDDMYVGRSDNILNQKFHITPRQLFTLFSQRLDEVQGPPEEEEKQVSLNYEPPFDENPSDKEIIEALIKHLKEQDGFLTAINCVSTKAILTWLEKQKEHKAAEFTHHETNESLKDAVTHQMEDDGDIDDFVRKGIDDVVLKYAKLGAKWQKEQQPAEVEWPNLSNCIRDCKKCQGKCFYRKEPYEAVERINLGNEFENQVSRILASVLNGEHEYNEGFVKYAAQSLLGYAKQEQKPAEVDEYEIIKKHITEDVLSSEVNKRLKECGWYVTDEKPEERNKVTINGEPIPTENQSIDIPLAEWSEEDEERLMELISLLKDAEDYLKEHGNMFSYNPTLLINWLKSLRPVSKESLQPHWKPSEEQMSALQIATIESKTDFKTLTSLLVDLKKLM